jgi:hypothetical protein
METSYDDACDTSQVNASANYGVPMAMARFLLVVTAVGLCSLVTVSAGAWALAQELTNCSDSELAQTDRAAQRVWQVLDSSKHVDGAYCDSTPYPYAGGSMDGPASEIVASAADEFGCREAPVEGLDDDDAAILTCDFHGDSYVLEITHEGDPYGSRGLEVGLYKR